MAGFSVYSGQILFDIARAFQGIGPALLLPNAIAIPGRTDPPGRRKHMVFSIGGFTIGALFSALFGQLAWWLWAYFATAIATLCLAVASFMVIPSDAVAEVAENDPSLLQRLDIFGIVTGVSGVESRANCRMAYYIRICLSSL